MKLIISILILAIGIAIGMVINIICHSQSEYHVQLLDYDQVEIMDQNHNLIKTTTSDSIGYYLEHDNI
jgi:hypothetical protein